MFCSGCGLALTNGQAVCPQCGRPVAAPVPPMPGIEFELRNYDGRVRVLGIAWLVYAGISLLFGWIGINFMNAFFAGHFGPWMGVPGGREGVPPFWFGPMLLHFTWLFLLLRAGLALIAGWGLMEREQWGRIIAIIAAFFSLLKFPFGTAMGIWTLVTLLGYRNRTLYEQL
ncbi:MAG: hypothetical protein WAN35_04060 [Terracidiphilus sp.]